MKKYQTKYLKQRVLESVFFPILISIFFALILKAGIYTNYKVLSVVSFVIVFIYNLIIFNRHICAVRHRKYFYPTNYATLGVTFAITFLASLIKGDFFIIFFMPYTLLDAFGFSRMLSVVCIHLLLALIIFVMPHIARQFRKRDMFF